MAQKITVRNNQTTADIALIAGGSADCLFEVFAPLNRSITDDLVPGEIISVGELQNDNAEVVNYYRTNNIEPTTGDPYKAPEVSGGIGHIVIGRSFIIK